MPALSIFEQPLNERIRLCMRLESMFRQMEQFHRATDYYEIQLFLDALFDVLDFLHRYEIRSELIKELHRYKNVVECGECEDYHPCDCSEKTILDEITSNIQSAHQINLNIISALRENELFNSLRQRSFLKSGNCLFEVPAYQHWLAKSEADKSAFLLDCYERFLPIKKSVDLILHLVRSGSEQTHQSSEDAMFLQTLDHHRTYQMIRIHIPQELGVFPRISGDKHRFSIRFMKQDEPDQRAKQINTPVTFDLQICAV
ncbi:cell division protein ZapD [Suttonella sp. R2A3]|uniref:cell division protein ZapD n=1 Tax=Suttonella sp. R2A3 TaxID=2908648 RepID=UPI001F289FC2|nr:cell division protein ZapD [Suttonella sp. R2A3]UJF24306.1 cell division protein ZapD [Suttonella sp. R2A3]